MSMLVTDRIKYGKERKQIDIIFTLNRIFAYLSPPALIKKYRDFWNGHPYFLRNICGAIRAM